MFFQKVCGIDLGTDTIKIRDKNGKYFLYSKNVIALREDGTPIAIGDAAYEIYEKNPANIRVVWPMAGGVIANSTEMEMVLSHLRDGDGIIPSFEEVFGIFPQGRLAVHRGAE